MGAYTEPPFIDFLREHEFRVIFEVGSRDGVDAVSLNETYHPDIIYVFEPNPEAADLCRNTLTDSSKYAFLQLALWHIAGQIKFYPVEYSIPWGGPKSRNIGASSCFRGSGAYGEQLIQREIVVQADTLAAVMARGDIRKIDLLCMDVQGAALNVLRGAGSRIDDIRFILTEAETKPMYEGEALLGEICAYLEAAGFRLILQRPSNDFFGDFLFENANFGQASTKNARRQLNNLQPSSGPERPLPAGRPVPSMEGGQSGSIPAIELVLPIKLENGKRGSDFTRARDGLIASLNRFADPDFVKQLSIIVPREDREAATQLASICKLPTNIVVEDELIRRDSLAAMPRAGWYIQQLIKLSYCEHCSTSCYLTLDADVFLMDRLGRDVCRDWRFPLHSEPIAAHAEWWSASARILESRTLAELGVEYAFGVTPAFINTDCMKETIARLTFLAGREGAACWTTYLAERTTLTDATWTEYSLYWLMVNNICCPDDLYYKRKVYEFCHSIEIPRAQTLKQWSVERSGEPPALFVVLQSSFVPHQTHAALCNELIIHGGVGNPDPFYLPELGRPEDSLRTRNDDFLRTFEERYAPKLLYRALSMRRAFVELLQRKPRDLLIVETGCMSKVDGDGRQYGPPTPPDHPWYPGGWHGPWSAGMSTLLFDHFVRVYGGQVFAVDQNQEHCTIARSNTSDQTIVSCDDSIRFLYNFDNPSLIDLLYLDSGDTDWENPHPSALHHLKELSAIFRGLSRGCLILIDDCRDSAGRSGKGLYINEFMRDLGYQPLVNEYQVLWRK